MTRLALPIWLLLAACLAAGCTLDMYDQERIEPLESSRFFADGQGARQPVAGTVARDEQLALDPYVTGRAEGQPVRARPPRPQGELPLDRAYVERGRQQYGLYCALCHGRTGSGEGMITRHGFPRAVPLDDERLRTQTTDGELYDIIARGDRRMPALGDRIEPDDRWRIVAYVRVLQLSRHAPVSKLPADLAAALEKMP